MNQINLINLIDLFQHFTENHLQLKRFGCGTVPQLERVIATSPEFPMMWSTLTDISYQSENLKTFNFNFMVMDLLKEDESNQNDIWNDSILVLEDLIKFLQYNTSDYYRVNFDSSLAITPFTEKSTEVVAGAVLKVTIEVDFDGQNACGIPMYDFTTSFNKIQYE